MTTIQPTFLYGVRSGIDNGVHFTGDSTLLYPAGSGVALVIMMIMMTTMMTSMTTKMTMMAISTMFRLSPLGPVIDKIEINLIFEAPFCWKLISGGDQRTESEPGLPGKQGDLIHLI